MAASIAVDQSLYALENGSKAKKKIDVPDRLRKRITDILDLEKNFKQIDNPSDDHIKTYEQYKQYLFDMRTAITVKPDVRSGKSEVFIEVLKDGEDKVSAPGDGESWLDVENSEEKDKDYVYTKYDWLMRLNITDDWAIACKITNEAIRKLRADYSKTLNLSNNMISKSLTQISDEIARSTKNILRVASLSAIGRDSVNPTITLDDVLWAKGLVMFSVEYVLKIAGVSGLPSEGSDTSQYGSFINSVVRIYTEKAARLGNDSLIPYVTKRDVSRLRFNKSQMSSDDLIEMAVENGHIIRVSGDDCLAILSHNSKCDPDGSVKGGRKPSEIIIPVLKNLNGSIVEKSLKGLR